ncbi:type II toxin-antitoxin system TacA family antitoxin [Maribrevibacterium harenarium]|nr:DUF1778 domain-containing protein [Maribrevibacterium harenarium]
MSMSHIPENVRLVARAPKEIQEIILNAAELSGASMSQFLIDAALDRAKVVFERDRLLKLSMDGANRFFDALDNPPKIQHLDNAYQSYKDIDNGVARVKRKS